MFTPPPATTVADLDADQDLDEDEDLDADEHEGGSEGA